MTRLLEQVLNQVSQLPAEQQDELAARWLEELNDDAHWDQRFAESHPQLSKIAADVRDAIRSGRVRDTGIDEL